MANIDRDLIKKLSELCRIGCTEEEIDALLTDMKKIVGHVEQLSEVDTANTAPCNSVIKDMSNVMREDGPSETMPRETFLSNAPEQVSGMIRVPPVIKKRE
jgi:aspartyl-tRNA(Asn)/glutamyl-tRNA(Gln) amidotransferase subunit C